MTTWGTFDVRFDAILASLARHSDLIDQEAATIDVVKAKQWRDKQASEVAQKEKDRSDQQRLSVISWLDVNGQPQDGERERLLVDCLPGSCDWILKHDKVEAWLRVDSHFLVVWLYGKPGASK